MTAGSKARTWVARAIVAVAAIVVLAAWAGQGQLQAKPCQAGIECNCENPRGHWLPYDCGGKNVGVPCAAWSWHKDEKGQEFRGFTEGTCDGNGSCSNLGGFVPFALCPNVLADECLLIPCAEPMYDDRREEIGAVRGTCMGYTPSSVGGTGELLVGGSDSPASAGSGSGPSAPYAAIASGMAAAALALVVGGWYVRRRLS